MRLYIGYFPLFRMDEDSGRIFGQNGRDTCIYCSGPLRSRFSTELYTPHHCSVNLPYHHPLLIARHAYLERPHLLSSRSRSISTRDEAASSTTHISSRLRLQSPSSQTRSSIHDCRPKRYRAVQLTSHTTTKQIKFS